MTKSQSNQAFNTASTQQGQNSTNAQSSYNAAQGDIGDYKSQLAAYAASNPYVAGGQFQTAQDQQMADTSAAGSQATQQALTGEMVRSGLNPTAAVAAGEQVAEKNAQTEMGAEAAANEARLSGLSNFNNSVLKASAEPEQMEQQLMNPQLNAEEGALGQETSASKTPSFWQELGQGVIQAGSAYAGGMAKACWIAARVFGGWENPRTILVRRWLLEEMRNRWYGELLLRIYMLTGEWIAEKLMPRSRLATGFFTWLFGKALKRSEEWLATVRGRESMEAYFATISRMADGVDENIESAQDLNPVLIEEVL